MLSAKGFRHKLIPFLMSVAMTFSVAACSNSPEGNDNASKTVPVTIMRIYRDTIENTVQYTGLVKPKQLAYAVAAIPGKVSASYFEVGDRVLAGDLLFTIDSTEIEDSISVLEEQLKVAEANVSLAETGVVAAMGSKYESQKIQLEASLKNAEDNFSAAKQTFDTAALLKEAGVINRLQYNQVKIQYEQSKNVLEAAIQAYELYENKLSKDAINAANDQLKQAQSSCDMLKLQIESTKKKLSYTNVTSPIDGIIATKDIVAGCLISNTNVPYTIMDSDTVQVVIAVTEKVINKVKKGDTLEVSIPAAKADPFEGMVSTVSPAVDQKTLAYNIYIDIPNMKNVIKPGMTAKVNILAESHANSIIVPLSSILSDDSGSYVYIIENDRAVLRPVSTGIINKDQVQILGGLEPGELLAVKGQQFLSPNDPVSISGEVSK